MKCGYRVKLLGQQEQFYDTDELLDKWVLDNFFKNPKNLERLRKYTKGKNILFDSNEEANAQAIALSKLDEITESLLKRTDRSTFKSSDLAFVYDKDTDTWDVEEQIAEDYKGLVSTTKFLNTTGNRSDVEKASVTGSNQDKYEMWLRDKIEMDMRTNEYPKWIKQMGDTEQSRAQWESKIKARQDEIIKKYRFKRQCALLIGDDVHKMFEVHALEKKGEIKNLEPGHILTEEDQKTALPTTKKIFEDICKRYNFSKNAQFFPEFTIFGKNIDSATKRVLKQKLGEDIDGILGRIDLLVIDKGKAYVFDFKTTAEKEVGDWSEMNNEVLAANNWWSSTKKLEAMKQVAMYLAILKEWGIEPGGGEVIPITVNYYEDADGYPENIETINITKGRGSIIKANSSNEHTNIKGLYLDTSTEKFPESERFKRSSSALIMYKYLPEAEKTVMKIKPLTVNESIQIEEDDEFMFPSRKSESNREFQATVNYYLGRDENGKKVGQSRLVELPSDSIDRLRGYRYRMFIAKNVDGGFGKGKPILFKSEDDEETIPKIQKYCDAWNEAHNERYNNFAVNLRNVMQIQGRDVSEIDMAVEELVGSDPRKKDYLKQMLSKYITGDWELYGANDLTNPLIQKGIFIFYKNDVIEVVCLSNNFLHYEVNFGTKRQPRKTILNGLSSERYDPHKFMSSSRGNMLLMKVLNIISKDPNIYRNGSAKIQKIIAINPDMMQSSWTDNDTLCENWKMMSYLSNGRLTGLSERNFVPPVQAALDEAKDLLLQSSVWTYVEGIFNNQLKTEQDVLKLIDIIKYKSGSNAFNSDGTPKIDTGTGYAVWCLLNALILKRNLKIPIEHDVGKILQGGLLPVGAYINSPGNAISVTIRTLDRLTGQFKLKYEEIVQKKASELNKYVSAVYKELNYNPNLQSRKDFWAQFFVQENGVVAKQMKIVSFNDTEFWSKYSTEVQKNIKYILDTLAQYKGIQLTPSAKTYMAADPDLYYEIPLSKGTMWDSLKKCTKKEGVRGVFNAISDRFKDIKTRAQGYYFGDESIYQEEDENEDLLQALTNRYCKYTPEQRNTWIQNERKAYSTDLEEILGNVVVAQSIYESSKLYGFLYAGVKTALAVNEKLGGEKVPELESFINDYITKIYKGQSIMDTSLRGAAEAINAIKGITSKMALGFNTRAFVREIMVSAYTEFLRAGNSKIPGVELDDMVYGIKYVLSHAPSNLKKDELMGQLNKRFGMVEQSRSELASSNFISDFALRTVDMDELTFMGTTLPDNWFRMAIVVAKMHHDECFEAYYLDENNILKYDARKDKRFNKYLTNDVTPVFKKYDSSMGSISDYNDAKALWDSYLEVWKIQKDNPNLLTLPDAYSPDEIRALQQRAGQLLGYFDEDQKSLMCSQFIGSALMQYKTWLSAKIDQWLKQPGFNNIWERVHVKDANGKRIYVLTHTSEEIRDGKPPIEFITEDQITEDMTNRGVVTPYIIEQGTFSEGMIQSTFNFASAILRLDWDEFLDMWKNDPVARGNFICGFVDMFGCMLFAGLVKLIFGEDLVNNKSAQSWFSQWTYGVLIGFAEDGPVHQVLGSMVGDWNPPSLLTIKRLAQTTQSVLQGNKTLPQGFIESFGATKEFSGYFRQQ